MKLKNKVAIVTGSARGIGKAIAIRFAEEGAKVVVNCLHNVDMADSVAQYIGENGGQAIVCRADVSQRSETDRMRDAALTAFRQIDIMVSNAGVVIDKAFIDSTDEDWDAAMAFLASNGAAYMTGQTIRVNSGMSMC
jgi:3-oxoacyl-[acyl-carrier protein] reductase